MSVFKSFPNWHKAFASILLIMITEYSLLSNPVVACSVPQGYKPAVNFELVYLSDAIVLAEVLGYGKEINTYGRKERAIKFKVIEILRGNVVKDFLELEGSFFEYFGPSDPEEGFGRARPGAYMGSCIAYDYRPKKTFLLFLRRLKCKGGKGSSWVVYRHAFARVNEQILGPTDPWLLAVRQYCQICAITCPEERLKQLKKLSEEATGHLARDLCGIFAIPTADKPIRLLADFLENSPGYGPRWAAEAMGNSGDHKAVPFLLKCLKSPDAPQEECAEALGKLRAKEAVDPLIKYFLASPPESQARKMTSNILGNIGDPKAIPVLRTALEEEKDSSRAHSFAFSLFMIPAAQTKKIAHHFLWHSSPQVRIATAYSLAQNRVAEAKEWLEERKAVEVDAEVIKDIDWGLNYILHPPAWELICE